MFDKPVLGLLPLYLELYDAIHSDSSVFDPFIDSVRTRIVSHGVKVIVSETCRTDSSVRKAIKDFERDGADMIGTLHLAYSPSGESAGALIESQLPLTLIDTTRDYDFSGDVNQSLLMFNHGIHGVQDLASVLRRNRRPYSIVAGHWSESDVLNRVASLTSAARASNAFKSMRTLRIGERFKNMNDFASDDEAATLMDCLGIEVNQITPGAFAESIRSVSDADIDAEMALNATRYRVDAPDASHRRSVRTGLGIRRYLDANRYGAFSANFLAFDSPDAEANCMPFLEACESQARGIGYAGEGDVLTASLVGAFLNAFSETTFTEIFCPDWKNDNLFFSHMGEFNPKIAADKPSLFEKNFIFTPAENPVYLAAAFKPGHATLLNLSPGPEKSFRLIASDLTILDDLRPDIFEHSVRAWAKPCRPIADFLEAYSVLGGTHHSALVYGLPLEAARAFAQFAGLEYQEIK